MLKVMGWEGDKATLKLLSPERRGRKLVTQINRRYFGSFLTLCDQQAA